MFFFLKPIKWAFKLLSLIVFALVIYVVVSGVQVITASGGGTATPSGARAIVVTGSPASANPDADLIGRLQQALTLYRAHVAPTIVVAGPSGSSGTASIPTAARGWLAQNGVPAGALRSVATSNSSEYAAIVKVLGAGPPVIIVTDAADELLATHAASSAGLAPVISVVPGSKKLFLDELGPLLRQATGIAAGRVVGFDHVPWAAN